VALFSTACEAVSVAGEVDALGNADGASANKAGSSPFMADGGGCEQLARAVNADLSTESSSENMAGEKKTGRLLTG